MAFNITSKPPVNLTKNLFRANADGKIGLKDADRVFSAFVTARKGFGKGFLDKYERDYPLAQKSIQVIEEQSTATIENGLIVLPTSTLTRVVNLAYMFFEQRQSQYTSEIYQEWLELGENGLVHFREFFYILRSLPEISQIEERLPTDGEMCDNFVFGKEEWHKQSAKIEASENHPLRALFESREELVAFLNEKGYEVFVENPQPGDIVVYFSLKNELNEETWQPEVKCKAAHYARVITSHEEVSKMTVQSKFSSYDVMQHLIGAVPHYYGDRVLFARKIDN